MTIQTRRKGKVLTIIMDRPEARNAVNKERALLLHKILTDFEKDSEVFLFPLPPSPPSPPPPFLVFEDSSSFLDL